MDERGFDAQKSQNDREITILGRIPAKNSWISKIREQRQTVHKS